MVSRLSVDRGAFFLKTKMIQVETDFFDVNLNANNHFCPGVGKGRAGVEPDRAQPDFSARASGPLPTPTFVHHWIYVWIWNFSV